MTAKLRDMTWTEAEPIYRAFHEGREFEIFDFMEGVWFMPISGMLSLNSPYRIPITPDTVDWTQLPEWAMWVARDGHQTAWAFEREPLLAERYWGSDWRTVPITEFPFYTPGTCDWTESLQQRPEGE